MGQFGIGQAVTRIEDHRLLTGGGRYTDDISLDGQAYAFILRSPMPTLKLAPSTPAPPKPPPAYCWC